MLIRPFDVLCLSHLRWEFVYQRPQHLMTRFARTRRVFFLEEPTYVGGPWDPLSTAEARLDALGPEPGLTEAVVRIAKKPWQP